MSSRYVSAINHVRSGIRILDEVCRDQHSGTYHHPGLKASTITDLDMANLRKIFIRLQRQAWTLTRFDLDKPLLKPTGEEENRYSEIPYCFSSIGEAHDFFEYLLGRFYYKFNESTNPSMGPVAPNAGDSVVKRYEPLLKRWSDALYRFEQSRGALITHKERIGLKILRIHQEYMQFVLLDRHNTGRTDPCSWDKYNFVFENIVMQASSVLDMTGDVVYQSPLLSQPSDETTAKKLKPSFSLNVGIITTIYDIATLCRDPSIRRKAVSVLRSASRQEGLLNSNICAVVAEKIIAFEETVASKGGGSDDPKSRASIVHFFLGSERQQLHQTEQKSIKRSFEVPDTARLPFAYPIFDTINKKVFLTIDYTRGMPVKIPLPAMTVILDMER